MRIFGVLFLVVVWFGAVRVGSGAEAAKTGAVMDGQEVVITLHRPRVLAHAGDFAALRERLAEGEPQLEWFARIVRAKAEQALNEPVIVHKKIGRRLLRECRNSLARTLALSMAYRLFDDERYARRAREELLAAAELPDWNPSHWLDVAELALGVAVGYDWLYETLSERERSTIELALIQKCLDTEDTQWFWKTGNNWNQVCTAGLAAAALALADTQPERARDLLSKCLQNQRGLENSYAPDGVYPEGPMYWGYGTAYSVVFIELLRKGIGDDRGLAQAPGFLASAQYRLHSDGPVGAFSFADCPPALGLSGCLGWFARELGDPALAGLYHAKLNDLTGRGREKGERLLAGYDRLFPLELLHYIKAGQSEQLPLDWHGRGVRAVAIMRSGWDRDALYAGIVAGSNGLSHSHLDIGSFVFDALGERWVRDLGMESYNISEEIWDGKPGGKRWCFFRINSRGHCVPEINGNLQRADSGDCPLVLAYSSPQRAHAVVDMSGAYAGQLAGMRRGLALIDGRSRLLVQDEYNGAQGSVRWQLIVPEPVEISGARATLRQNGKRLHLRILNAQGREFSVSPALPDYHPDENKNEGFVRLAVEFAAAGDATLAVLLEPERGDGTALPEPQLVPLAEWEW